MWQALEAGGLSARLAWASEAALGTAWRDQVGAAGEGTLADAPADLAGGADEAVARAAEQVTLQVLDALTRAGSDRRADLNDALDDVGARLAGTDAGGPPPRLAVWRSGELVALDP